MHDVSSLLDVTKTTPKVQPQANSSTQLVPHTQSNLYITTLRLP